METLTRIFYIPLNSILIFIAITLGVWFCLQDSLTYWKKRGVPHINPFRCIYLTIAETLRWKSDMQIINEHYQELEGETFGGAFELLSPVVILREPTMVKEWLVKSYTNFPSRVAGNKDDNNKSLSGNLFSLNGDRWRLVRNKMAPAFSSVKLKAMFETLKLSSTDLNEHLEELRSGKSGVDIEIKGLMIRYAMDVMGACAFGAFKFNAIKDPDNCKMVANNVKNVYEIRRRQIFFFLGLLHPKLPGLLGFAIRSSKTCEFMTSLTKDVMEMKRSNNNQKGKDFIQILIEDSKNSRIEGFQITENIVAGVVSSFFAAGYETLAATVTHCLFELAFHPEFQDRIFTEIQDVKTNSEEEIRFEDHRKLQYLDQVIKETLRKYPIAGIVYRHCDKPFQIPNSSVVIERGVNLAIPVCSFQHDPKYFPEPNKFDPERFSEENIHKIVPGSYLPFGEGPRFCIANRLTIMELKAMLLSWISNYMVHPCAKTKNRLEADLHVMTLAPKGDVWIRLEKRI